MAGFVGLVSQHFVGLHWPAVRPCTTLSSLGARGSLLSNDDGGGDWFSLWKSPECEPLLWQRAERRTRHPKGSGIGRQRVKRLSYWGSSPPRAPSSKSLRRTLDKLTYASNLTKSALSHGIQISKSFCYSIFLLWASSCCADCREQLRRRKLQFGNDPCHIRGCHARTDFFRFFEGSFGQLTNRQASPGLFRAQFIVAFLSHGAKERRSSRAFQSFRIVPIFLWPKDLKFLLPRFKTCSSLMQLRQYDNLVTVSNETIGKTVFWTSQILLYYTALIFYFGNIHWQPFCWFFAAQENCEAVNTNTTF